MKIILFKKRKQRKLTKWLSDVYPAITGCCGYEYDRNSMILKVCVTSYDYSLPVIANISHAIKSSGASAVVRLPIQVELNTF